MTIVFYITKLGHYKIAYSDLSKEEKLHVIGIAVRFLRRFSSLFKKDSFFLERIIYPATSVLLGINRCRIACFSDNAFRSLPRGFLSWYHQKKPMTKTVLFLDNKVSLIYGLPGDASLDELHDKSVYLPFDKIYSYDINECQKYGFEFAQVYSRVPNIVGSDRPEGAYYCGAVPVVWKSYRLSQIDQLSAFFIERGVKFSAYVVVAKKVCAPKKAFYHKRPICYRKILQAVATSNVIIELVSGAKHGATYRYYEAIVYNKKLLSNNPDLEKMPFYNPRFMKKFERLDDIDVDWCKKVEPVDYGYRDCFSPRALFKNLLELLK